MNKKLCPLRDILCGDQNCSDCNKNMEICKKDKDLFENSNYCPICSYKQENQLLKDNIEILNDNILRLNEELKVT